MTQRKIRMRVTTTLGSIRYVKGQVVELDEAAARNLVALGKAENVLENTEPARDDKRPVTSAKAKRGD